MSRGEHGEQVGAGWRVGDVERTAEPWCRFSGTCYKRDVPVHQCDPAHGNPYADGCPRDEACCAVAQVLTGRPYKEAVTTVPVRYGKRGTIGYRPKPCADCGIMFAPTGPNSRRCACCAAEHRRRKWREYNRRYQLRRRGA